ncbi:MAG: hypothetical protein Q7T92_02285 [Lutibacter sp.]|nr:hypothetical protein [Lutibacter sp.]
MKKQLIITVCICALFAACADTTKKNIETQKQEEKSIIKNDAETKMEQERIETARFEQAEKRKLDSLQQVQSHGHAH